MKRFLFIVFFSFNSYFLFAQVVNTGISDTTTGEHIGKIVLGAYVDAYYGYNFNQPNGTGNIPYLVSMSTNNSVSINLAYVDLRYNAKRMRCRFVPGFGTYMNANYANEPGTIKNIVEASAGFKLFEKKDIWVDFGVIGSPYTNESYLSKDHLMYTRSLAAENTPYYLTGAKLTAPLGKKVNGYLYFLNGWQQIQDLNKGKSVGTQLEYRPDKRNLINWNTYIGDERSILAPQNRMRYFTDLYWICNPDGKVSITSDVHVGLQKRKDSLNSESNNVWWQANFIARYRFSDTYSLSGRIEYYNDPKNVIVKPLTGVTGYSTYSTGLCFNAKILNNALYRFEGRYFFSDKNLYFKDSSIANNSFWLITNVTFWF